MSTLSAVTPLPGVRDERRSIPDLIGNTPRLRLSRIAPSVRGTEVFAKAEWFNPGGSVKKGQDGENDEVHQRASQEIAGGQVGKAVQSSTDINEKFRGRGGCR